MVIAPIPETKPLGNLPAEGTPTNPLARFMGRESMPEQMGHGGPAHNVEETSANKASVKNVEEAGIDKSTGPRGWKDAGDGYCEDGRSHEEFSSLHASGKTLEACAETGLSDLNSIAFDFSAADGGCDIRYVAGAFAKDVPGYEWWAWGAGTEQPTGSGKQKHDTSTRCYARITVPTAPPLPGSRAQPMQRLHPAHHKLIKEYPFQPVRTNRGQFVNIILVRSPFRSRLHEDMFKQYHDTILFLGICSFEDFPLPPPNPFSAKFPIDTYTGKFPGFLHMFRNPEKIFPSHVKLLLMSQSDFSLPPPMPKVDKIYDFTFSGSDQDVANDCVGWSSFAKNWTLVKQTLEIMCGELGMTGVLVATKDKQNVRACSIPASCQGKIEQTQYLSQEGFWGYVRKSRFLFVPQVHDASPRVTTQALALDVPLLMNRNLIGGWKYVNEKTGEFFNDASDFKENAQKILRNINSGGVYEPRKWAEENVGDGIHGSRLMHFVADNFQDRVHIPEGTTHLFPSGA